MIKWGRVYPAAADNERVQDKKRTSSCAFCVLPRADKRWFELSGRFKRTDAFSLNIPAATLQLLALNMIIFTQRTGLEKTNF